MGKLNWTKEQLNDLYHTQNLSMVEIAEQYGCHRDAVLYWLKKFEIPRKFNYKKKRIDEKHDWLFQKYIVEQLSTRQIAELTGVDHATVNYWLRRCGIPIRTHSEASVLAWKTHTHPHLGKRGSLSYMFGRKQSKEMIEKRIKRGPNHYMWKGGVRYHPEGYRYVKCVGHPNADQNGYVLEHRLVMEEKIGRFLEPVEVVHHINGNVTDNRVENLALTNKEEHGRYHTYKRYHGEADICITDLSE